VVARWQLLGLGLSGRAIRHRLAVGRLHRVERGVYAVGRPGLTRHGMWMAAVLGAGPGAVLSHGSAAALWGIQAAARGRREVTVPTGSGRRRSGVVVHRRPGLLAADLTTRRGIPVTRVVRTLLDVACSLDARGLERAIDEADRLGLIDPEMLAAALERCAGQAGVGRLRAVLGGTPSG
jgi:predicted transcriptional regulator of viral defense system